MIIDAAKHSPYVDARSPGVIRREMDGCRSYWKGGPANLPTVAEREAAKKTFCMNAGPSAICACCAATTAVIVDCVSIRDTGLCKTCLLYSDGKLDGVIVHRMPTIDEVLECLDEPRRFEVTVMREELRGRTQKPGE